MSLARFSIVDFFCQGATLQCRGSFQIHTKFSRQKEVIAVPSLADMGWVSVDVYRTAKKHNLKLTLKALKEAKRFHEGMKRADGREAIVHPHKVCQILMFYMLMFGVLNDVMLAAALLHDVLEDVSDKVAAMKRIHKKFPEAVTSLVVILSKGDEADVREYCRRIGNKIGAVLIKLADRLHNLRNMIRRLGITEFFTEKRLRDQVAETNECILKLFYWVQMFEGKFPSKNQDIYLRIAEEMTADLRNTVHLAQVALGDLVV